MCSVNSGRQTSAVHPLQAKSALGEVGPGAFCLGVGRTAADLIVLCLEARREAWGPWGHGSPGTAELHFGAADIAAQEMPSRILPVRWGQHVLPTQGTKEQVRSYLGIDPTMKAIHIYLLGSCWAHMGTYKRIKALTV